MEKIIMMLLEISLMTSIVIVGMILLKPLFNKKYGVKMRYFIWLFITLRLLIPFNVSFPKAVEIQVPSNNTTFIMPISYEEQPLVTNEPIKIDTSNAQAATVVKNTAPPISSVKTISLWDLGLGIWLVGCLLTLGYQLCKYFIFLNTVKSTTHISLINYDAVLNEIEDKYHRRSNIQVYENPNISSPMLIGFIHPMIIINDSQLPLNQQKIILEHELVHHIRHDLYFKLMLLIVRSIHWFNPVVYLMVKEANKDIEFSCDEQVLTNSSVSFRREYGDTILALLKSSSIKKSSELTTSFNGDKKVVKERFSMLVDMQKKSKGIKIIVLSLLLVSMAASLVSCSQQKTVGENVTVKEIEDMINYTFYDDIQLIFAKSDQIVIDTVENKSDSKLEYTTFIARAKNEYNRDVEVKMAVVKLDKPFDDTANDITPLDDFESVFFLNNAYGIYYHEDMRVNVFVDMKNKFRMAYLGEEITEENIDENLNVCSIVIPNQEYVTEITVGEKTDNLNRNSFSRNYGDNIKKGELPYAYKLNNEIIEKCKFKTNQENKYFAADWVKVEDGYNQYLEELRNSTYLVRHIEKSYFVKGDEIIELQNDEGLEKVNIVFTDNYSKQLDKFKIDYELIGNEKVYVLEEDLVIKYPENVSENAKLSYNKSTGEIWEYYELSTGEKIPMDYNQRSENGIVNYIISTTTLLLDFPDVLKNDIEIIPSTMSDSEITDYITSQQILTNKSSQGYRE